METMVKAHCLDGRICIPNCDKIVPGMLMAAMRCNNPAILLSGGPMKAGVTKDGRVVTLVTVVEGVAAYKLGNLNDGRFSGGTHGAAVGYVSSEAAGGGDVG